MRELLPDVNSKCYAANAEELQLWHERLAHQNKTHVKQFLKQLGYDVIVNEEFCESCQFGKHHRLSFGTRSKEHFQKPCDLIHSDVCGPMEVDSIGGRRYFVDFKDEFSKYRTVYFMKEKSEVVEKLKLFLAEVSMLGHKVKELLTDNGKEYCNTKVSHVLGQYGVNHRTSMPDSPEQNGSAERENRTLVESARSMIYAKSLPTKLWAEAVNTAAYVINRTGPTNVSGKSPYELWQGKKASIHHMTLISEFPDSCLISNLLRNFVGRLSISISSLPTISPSST